MIWAWRLWEGRAVRLFTSDWDSVTWLWNTDRQQLRSHHMTRKTAYNRSQLLKKVSPRPPWPSLQFWSVHECFMALWCVLQIVQVLDCDRLVTRTMTSPMHPTMEDEVTSIALYLSCSLRINHLRRGLPEERKYNLVKTVTVSTRHCTSN